MTRRLGTLLYWLGTVLAVLAILSAVTWNVRTLQQRQQAQENLRNVSPDRVEQETALAEAFARQRASTESLKLSVTYGGVLVLAGLIVYGLGLAARYASRMPNKDRRE